MTERVFVLEPDKEKFSYWKHPVFGLGAQLEALGVDGDSMGIEQLTSAADLRLVGTAVRRHEELPARALVLANIMGSDLRRNPTQEMMGNPMVLPQDFQEGVDPRFIIPEDDDCRPLDPYGRFIAARLIQKSVPDVQFGSNFDFGSALYRLNRMLGAHDTPFMSIVDATRRESRQYPVSTFGASFGPVVGADVVVKPSVVTETAHVNVDNIRYSEEKIAANQIGAVATLVSGVYPDAEPKS